VAEEEPTTGEERVLEWPALASWTLALQEWSARITALAESSEPALVVLPEEAASWSWSRWQQLVAALNPMPAAEVKWAFVSSSQAVRDLLVASGATLCAPVVAERAAGWQAMADFTPAARP